MLIAVTRAVSPTLADCELTLRPRDPINVADAMAEHAFYEETLRSLGATVVHAPPEPTLPDAVFVEDTAVVLDEIAVMTRPGAATRRGEIESIATVLSAYNGWYGSSHLVRSMAATCCEWDERSTWGYPR